MTNFPVKFPDNGNFDAETGLLETASTTKSVVDFLLISNYCIDSSNFPAKSAPFADEGHGREFALIPIPAQKEVGVGGLIVGVFPSRHPGLSTHLTMFNTRVTFIYGHY